MGLGSIIDASSLGTDPLDDVGVSHHADPAGVDQFSRFLSNLYSLGNFRVDSGNRYLSYDLALHLVSHFPRQAIRMGDSTLTACSYNSAGGCGDSIFHNPQRAMGKSKCLTDLCVQFDVTMFQEMHSDDLEAKRWNDRWINSHVCFWSYSSNRNQGGICTCFKRSQLRGFDFAFAV